MKLEAKARLSANWQKDLEEETSKEWKEFVTSISSLVKIESIGDPSVYEGDGGEVYFSGKEDNPLSGFNDCISLATMKKIMAHMERLPGNHVALCPWEENQLAVLWARS